MNDKIFVDTNVVVYLYSEDDAQKRNLSRALFKDHQPLMSTQVLNELANVLRKKFKLEYPQIAKALQQTAAAGQVTLITLETIVKALNLADKYHYSHYDSLILAAALLQQCTIVYSEDLQHGQLIDNQLRIINPFL